VIITASKMLNFYTFSEINFSFKMTNPDYQHCKLQVTKIAMFSEDIANISFGSWS